MFLIELLLLIPPQLNEEDEKDEQEIQITVNTAGDKSLQQDSLHYNMIILCF